MQKYLLIAASTLLCASAFAQGQPTQQPTFESLDKNADQKISAQEAKADSKLAAQFATLDGNRDGYLDPMEFSKYARS